MIGVVKLSVPLLVALLLTAPATAFDRGVPANQIIVVPDSLESDPDALRPICRSLADSLREHGREVIVFDGDPLTLDRSGVRVIVLVSAAGDSSRDALVGVGGAGHHNVGADVDLVRSHAAARVDLLHPATLELIDSFELDERSVRPIVSSINLGDRHGYLRIPIWFGRQSSRTAAARNLGERIAERLIAHERAR